MILTERTTNGTAIPDFGGVSALVGAKESR